MNKLLLKYQTSIHLVDSTDFSLPVGAVAQNNQTKDTYLVIPYHQAHWTLLVIKLQPYRKIPGIFIFHLDSLLRPIQESKTMAAVQTYLKRKYFGKNLKLPMHYDLIPCQRQKNSDDCGVQCVRKIKLLMQIPAWTFALTAETFKIHLTTALNVNDDLIPVRETFEIQLES